ncbi:MAG: hypothetical protein LBR54_00745, partial [Oscillospiraceae bacterium]|nr:hypothetical protein [Oscillospiraceae bacterium]
MTKSDCIKFIDSINTPAVLWSANLKTVIFNSSLKYTLKLYTQHDETAVFYDLFAVSYMDGSTVKEIAETTNYEVSVRGYTKDELFLVWNTAVLNSGLLLSVSADITKMKHSYERINRYCDHLTASEGRYRFSM